MVAGSKAEKETKEPIMQKQIVVVLTVLVALAFGCGKEEKTYKTAEGEVKIKQESGEATYEGTTKEGKFKVAVGDKGVALPDNFPKDVPILKGATVKVAVAQGKQMTVQLLMPGSIADVAKSYQDELKSRGWEIDATMNMGEASMLNAKKGNRQCAIVAGKDSNGTMVQLTVSGEDS